MSEINFCNTKEQLNHLGEVVTGKVDGSPSGADIDTSTLPYTGQVRKTLPALEAEYQEDIDDFNATADQVITDKTAEFDASIASKESEADAAIDEYRQTNKGDYVAGITLENNFEYIAYNGESYFATNPPYTTTATTPDNDTGNLFVGGYLSQAQVNLIANLGDSQVAGGKIWPIDNRPASTADTGLVNVSYLRGTSGLYKLSKKVNGDITTFDESSNTATIGGETVGMWVDVIGHAPEDAQISSQGIPAVTFPPVSQTITTPLSTDGIAIAGGNLVFKGEKREKSIINADIDTPLPIRDNAHLSGFTMIGNVNTDYGNPYRGITTTDTGLQAYSVFDNTKVDGYRIGAFIRNAVNQSYTNLNWRRNRCHVMLARAPYVADNSNPVSPGGWNQANGQGFFHNINRFSGCNFSFGEVAIMGVSLCGVFDNVSTQAQKEDSSGNNVLPDGHRGTGVWLQGGGESGSRRGSGANSFRGWYSEASEQGLFIKDQEYFEMSASFMQGGSNADPARFAEVDNSIAHFRGVIKYDWFTDFIVKNNSTVYHSDASQGSGGAVTVDQSSKYRPRGDIDRDKWESTFSVPSSSSGNVYPLDGEVPERGFATLRVILLNNGINQEVYTADIARYSNGLPVIEWRTSPSARFTATGDVNGVIRLTLTTNNSLTVDALLTIEGGADISGNSITILPE